MSNPLRPLGTILVVEDDLGARLVASEGLRAEGFTVREAGTAKEAIEHVEAGGTDLIILDLGLPDADGLQLLQQLRLENAIPIVVVSGRSGELDRVLGLELGADDYVVKPFSPRELAARVKAVLRRGDAPRPVVLSFGDITLDARSRQVTLAGAPVETTAKEFDLLNHLASSPGKAFTREELLQSVWQSSDQWQTPATVTEHMRRLRTKLEADPAEPKYLLTVRGIGYRLAEQG